MLGNFPNCFSVTEIYEGWHKFSDDPHDPGGATYNGVTQRTWSAYCIINKLPPWPVRHMTDAECQDLYKQQYWDKIDGDRLPKGLDLSVYDEGVNSGVVQAIKALQRVLGVTVDGHIGMETLATAQRQNDIAALINDYNNNRLSFLHRLRTWSFFKNGWTVRVDSIKAKSLTMVYGGTNNG